MRRIHIYNLDHDYALGDNSHNYTPPKAVRRMRNKYACFPAVYAEKGDCILYVDSDASNLPDKETDFMNGYNTFGQLIRLKELEILRINDLPNLDYDNITFTPWGWDASLIAKLERSGVPRDILPFAEKTDTLREASSRFTSALFFDDCVRELRKMSDIKTSDNRHYSPFEELKEIRKSSNCEEVIDFFQKHVNIYVKAPWSSSGRGLIFTDELNETQVAQWSSGIIRKQGGVVMEKAYDRVTDFSTEWMLTSHGPEFIGFGLFTVSSRGKYKSNSVGSSDELKEQIVNSISKVSGVDIKDADILLDKIVECQKDLVHKYFGELVRNGQNIPLGIDMFLTKEGLIHPCVEVNLRNTMGHVALMVNKQLQTCNEELRKELCKFASGNEISLPVI